LRIPEHRPRAAGSSPGWDEPTHMRTFREARAVILGRT
jgi:hypothetical protein